MSFRIILCLHVSINVLEKQEVLKNLLMETGDLAQYQLQMSKNRFSLQELEDSPTTSTRKIAATLHVSHSTVFRVLKNQLMYPYHIQRVQALVPTDFPARVALCRLMQQKIADNPHHLAEILFTDEANFSRDAISNFHNNHIWADENPHAIVESRHQHQFSLNVWVGIVGGPLIGPLFLPARLTGDVYRQFLEHDLPTLLEDIPLQLRSKMYFMHDGAPAHFSLVARNYLNTVYPVYPRRWIGRARYRTLASAVSR